MWQIPCKSGQKWKTIFGALNSGFTFVFKGVIVAAEPRHVEENYLKKHTGKGSYSL